MNTSYTPPFGYSGFWKRGAAFFVDLVIIMFPQAYLGDAFGSAFVSRMTTADPLSELIGYSLWAQLIAVVVAWVYTASMESSLYQATFGKLLMGIRVVNLSGERLSFSQSSLRFLGRIGSAILVGLGFVAIAFSEKKQGLHDMLANTLVVNKEPVDPQTHYERVNNLLRSPVIAALVIACGAVISINMIKQPMMAGPTDSISTLGMGSIRVIHSTEKPIVMQQILTGPNVIENGREYVGPIRVGTLPVEIKSVQPISLALSSQKATPYGMTDGSISIKLEGNVKSDVSGNLKTGVYNEYGKSFDLYGVGF